jgi:hypothetical protein
MNIGRLALATLVIVTLSTAGARAADVSAKRLSIKDPTNPAKRQILVQSNDPAVQFAGAGNPAVDGAILHVYSATDDDCIALPAGPGWVTKKSTWKFKDKSTGNTAQVKNGKLLVKIKSGVSYSLADNGSQGHVDAQVQLGNGTRWCMRCAGNKKDLAKQFLGTNCPAAACDPEPSTCAPAATTTTIATTTTTTTVVSNPGQIVKGALTPTPGRFNYDLQIGLPAANSACSTRFAGTHACSYTELQSAQAAGDLVGLKDAANGTVTAFWAIDSSAPPLQQCNDDALGGSGLNWEYGTAHTAARGEKVALDNAAGTLGPLQTSLQCNFSTAWVGCCQ